MNILGIPKETKVAERRVALTPEHCRQLIKEGICIFVEQNAGTQAGFSDNDYIQAGCQISENSAALYAAANIIIKVKEPQPEDLENLKTHHTLFCYLHLAAEPKLVTKLKEIGLTAIAFETVVVEDKTPLLAPMSAIAGRLAIQIGTWFLHAPRGGRGILMGGISGTSAGKTLVLGAGIAGTEAATLAHNMGARVTVMDINEARLAELKRELPNIETEISTPEAIIEKLKETSLLVGAVYVIGKKAPIVVTEKMIQVMPKGAVALDISIDQGGCIETSKPCTHDAPTYIKHGVIHSAITNLPAAAPHTASEILSTAIYPYVKELAQNTWSQPLKEAVNVQEGVLKVVL